jgi:tetratricopeptide (TPR) repeat protein
MVKKHRHFAIGLCAVTFACLLASPGLAAQPASAAIALYEQGKAAAADENYYLAIEKYKAALVQNPHYLDPIKGLAECFFFLDEYDEALRWVTLGKTYDKNDFSLLTLEGRTNIVLGNLDKARELFLATHTLRGQAVRGRARHESPAPGHPPLPRAHLRKPGRARQGQPVH